MSRLLTRPPLPLRAYLGASCLAGPLIRPLLARREARGKEDRARLSERVGHAGLPRPEGPLIWLHGASVGEAMSILPLIEALRRRSPARVLVTTGTVTSARRIAPLLPDHAIHQYVPVDSAAAVRRFLDHWRPDLGIWVESEIWPRLVTETAARGVPMALINARLSDRSAARWQRLSGTAAYLWGRFSLVVTQDPVSVHRLRPFGVRARFGGNLKALVPEPGCDPQALADMRAVLDGRPVWLAASTHPGEEADSLAAHDRLRARLPDALLILAPRHPERGETLAGEIANAGQTVARRSAGQRPLAETSVYLADTLGEMGLWYRLAPVTFVGGSLVARGGHTPFEPASLGTAILHGPHVENFAPAYAAFGEAGGSLAVPDAAALGTVLARLLSDPRERRDLVTAAEAAHRALCPDVDAMAADVLALMEAP